jgi:hypothetical protein
MNTGWPPANGGEYHGVELDRVPTNVLVWIVETYGPAGGAWFCRNNTIYFRDRADHTMFLLKWQ